MFYWSEKLAQDRQFITMGIIHYLLFLVKGFLSFCGYIVCKQLLFK